MFRYHEESKSEVKSDSGLTYPAGIADLSDLTGGPVPMEAVKKESIKL